MTDNLVLHLDASELTGLVDGNTVQTWTDMSAEENDAVRTGGTPTYKTGVINGQPVVRFGANNDDNFLFTRISTIRSVFWVLKENSGVGSDNFLLGDSSSYDFHRGGSNGPLWGGYTSGNIRNGVTKLMGTAINGESTALPSNSFQLISLVTSGGPVQANQITKDRVYRGSLRGDIAEILIYDRALTALEEESVGSYLAGKYGLATAYPPLGLTATLTSPTNNQEFISGSSVTATATVVSGTGPYSVQFLLNDAPVGAPVTAEPYTYDFGALADGTYDIKATVTDSVLDSDTSDIRTITVAPASITTTDLATSGTPSTYGDSVTFTATVSPLPSGGTVQFLVDGNPWGSPVSVSGGTADYSTTLLGAAAHSITAEYSGFGIYLASSASALSQTVDQAVLTVTADSKVRAPGAANPPLTYKISGYQNGEDAISADIAGSPVLSTLADALSPEGPYAITSTTGDLDAANYSFTAVDGILTVLAGAPPVANGMACWYDASSIAVADGAPVVTWDDLSGNGHTATSNNSSVTLDLDQVNSLPVVSLRGGNTYLNCAGGMFTKEQYLVVRSPNPTWNGSGSFLGRRSNDFLTVRSSSYNMYSGQTGYWDDQLPSAVSKNGAVVGADRGTMPRGGFQLGDIQQYMILKITVNGNASPANLAQYPFYQIGKNETLGTMDFDVAEIIGYDQELTDADEASMFTYLSEKYDIAVAIPTQFTNLTASQSISAGTASVTLGGTVSASETVYPAPGELVQVTIDGVTVDATVSGASGEFSVEFPTAAIPASGVPYPITYSYAGNATTLGATPDDTNTTLTVTDPGTGGDYDTWAGPGGYNLAEGPGGDDDGDGNTNLEEWAFGLNPTSGASVNPITVPLDPGTGTFTYTRRDPVVSDLVYSVWTSTDLDTWTEDEFATEGVITDDGNNVQTVPVTLGAAALATAIDGSLFVRVQAD